MLKSVKCELLIDFHRLSGFFLQPRCAKGGGKAFPTGIAREMRHDEIRRNRLLW